MDSRSVEVSMTIRARVSSTKSSTDSGSVLKPRLGVGLQQALLGESAHRLAYHCKADVEAD